MFSKVIFKKKTSVDVIVIEEMSQIKFEFVGRREMSDSCHEYKCYSIKFETFVLKFMT